MEKDLKESSSDETVGENTENQDVEQIADMLESERARQQELFEEMRNLQRAIQNNIKEMKYIQENLAMCDETFRALPPDAEVIYNPNEPLPQKSTDDETRSLRTDAEFKDPQSFTGLEESYDAKGKEAENPKFRYKKRSKPEVASSEASSQETPDKPSKEASGGTDIKTMVSQTSEADITTLPPVKRKVLESDESCSSGIPKLAGEIKTTGSQTSEADITIPPAVKRKVLRSDESCSSAISKLAGEIKTTGSQTSEADITIPPAVKRKVLRSDESCSSGISKLAGAIKTMGSQTSEADITIPPAVKRKVLESDESCSTGISKLAGARVDDNSDIKIAKKLKLHNDEKTSIQCPTVTIVQQKKYEQSDPSEYTDQSHTDQSSSESEQLPSSSGLTKVISHASSSDESSLLKVNDYFPCSDSSLTSGSNDATPSESKESTSTSISMDVHPGETAESSVKSSSNFSEIFASTNNDASSSNSEEL